MHGMEDIVVCRQEKCYCTIGRTRWCPKQLPCQRAFFRRNDGLLAEILFAWIKARRIKATKKKDAEMR